MPDMPDMPDMPEYEQRQRPTTLTRLDIEMQRHQRIAALSHLAQQQLTGGALPVYEPLPFTTVNAPQRSYWRLVVAFGTLALLVALIGTLLVTRGILPLSHNTQMPATAAATATPLPCANQNVRVSDDLYLAHSEPMVAEDPSNPLHLVGASKFFTDPAHYRFQIGTFASFDGGCNWTDNELLPGFPPHDTVSDVTIAFALHNAVYVAVLYTDGNLDSGVAVLTSHDGGLTFAPPVHVFDDPTGQVFSDKPWIAVDQTHGPRSGSIYVAWSYDYGAACGAGNFCHQGVGFSRSTNGGASFTPVQQIEGQATYCTNPAPTRDPSSTLCDAALGATPVVEPDGSIAVAFAYEDLIDSKIPTRLLVVVSHDGGLTWAAPSLVATISDVYGSFPLSRYRNVTLPAFACDPVTGQLVIAWSDKATGDADILFSTSHDDAQTWSAPLRVNDDPLRDGAYQFQPQLAIAPDGVISISFFDTRLDPNHVLIDVYLAQSVNHGASFLPNVRVTRVSWNPSVDAPVDSSGAEFIGDYQGMAADNFYVHPFWNDTRTGAQNIFTDAIPSATSKH